MWWSGKWGWKWTTLAAIAPAGVLSGVGSLAILLGTVQIANAQWEAAAPWDEEEVAFVAQSRSLVDTPTAGLLPSGTFETRSRLYPGGGLDVRLELGLADWVSLGASYGGVQIIGDGDPDWNPEPGFFFKARLIQETWSGPAIAFGIDTQGSGYYDGRYSRFQYKSRGLYMVASKNYAWYGDLTLHGGLSRSLEKADDKDPTVFAGLEKSLGNAFGIAVEFDLATNDDRDDGVFGKGRGYLNGAVRWNVAPQMQLRLVLRDMLDNSESVDPRFSDRIVDEGWGREVTFSYAESF